MVRSSDLNRQVQTMVEKRLAVVTAHITAQLVADTRQIHTRLDTLNSAVDTLRQDTNITTTTLQSLQGQTQQLATDSATLRQQQGTMAERLDLHAAVIHQHNDRTNAYDLMLRQLFTRVYGREPDLDSFQTAPPSSSTEAVNAYQTTDQLNAASTTPHPDHTNSHPQLP